MRILIAEDNRMSAAVLERTLRALGHEPTIVGDGIDAWSRIENEGFRFVISDWLMPGLDGLELCRRIRAIDLGRYVYTMLVTGKLEEESVLKALAAGADEFVRKPIRPAELAIRLRTGQRILALEDGLRERVAEVERALAEVRELRGLLPICCVCKKVRDGGDYWRRIEDYLSERTDAEFSHGYCPDCYAREEAKLDALDP